MLVHHDELSAQDLARVNIAGVRLKALIVAQDLRSGCGGHGRHEQGVAYSVFQYLFAQSFPIPATAQLLGVHAPQIELELPLAHRASLISLIRSVCLGFFNRSLDGREVDRLKDFLVELFGLIGGERHAEFDEGVGQSLNTQSDRTVPHIAVPRLFDRIVVPVDDAVQVACRLHGDRKKLFMIEFSVLHEHGKGDAGQIADRYLVRCTVFHDLGAEIGRANGSQILLIALDVGGVLVEHIGRSGFDLGLEYLQP